MESSSGRKKPRVAAVFRVRMDLMSPPKGFTANSTSTLARKACRCWSRFQTPLQESSERWIMKPEHIAAALILILSVGFLGAPHMYAQQADAAAQKLILAKGTEVHLRMAQD